jgi:hypothetical protein
VNPKFLCSLAVAGAFAFGGAANAFAAPAGPEGPASCSFSGGATTCAHVGAPVVTSSTTSPDQNGCTTTNETTTTTTTYSAHRGTYNSNGTSVAAPADTSTSSTREVSHDCPPSGASAEQACESLGYNYSDTERQQDFYTQPSTVLFTCGEGNDLTLAQSQAISSTDVQAACRQIALTTDPNTTSTVYAAGYPATFPDTGWYYACYSVN